MTPIIRSIGKANKNFLVLNLIIIKIKKKLTILNESLHNNPNPNLLILSIIYFHQIQY